MPILMMAWQEICQSRYGDTRFFSKNIISVRFCCSFQYKVWQYSAYTVVTNSSLVAMKYSMVFQLPDSVTDLDTISLFCLLDIYHFYDLVNFISSVCSDQDLPPLLNVFTKPCIMPLASYLSDLCNVFEFIVLIKVTQIWFRDIWGKWIKYLLITCVIKSVNSLTD